MALLEVDDISIHFGGVRAVDGVSFTVEPGEVFTIIGPNGAGKSTTFNLISRIYDCTHGRLIFEDEDITKLAPHKVAAKGIARTFQNVELFEMATVLQNLLVGCHVKRNTNLFEELLFAPRVREQERDFRHRVEEVIELLDLQHYRDTMIQSLPYGVRKVTELARALAMEPKLLLLDEPSSGLNVEETEDMAFWITDIQKELGITVLMVEHDMKLVSAVSDRVLAMDSGRMIAHGTPAEVQSHPEVIRAYLGDDGVEDAKASGEAAA